jgi:hypothetical protein
MTHAEKGLSMAPWLHPNSRLAIVQRLCDNWWAGIVEREVV